MTSSRTVRLGIIGAGGFANTHMEAFTKIPGVEVVAFCRRNPQALEEMQAKWGVHRGFTDYREMLGMDLVDAVDIITPTDSHHPITMDVIRAGKHVMCDKPLAMTAGQCREMLEAADKAGVVHCTNFNQRGRTPAGHMRRYLDDGFIGRLYHLNIWWGMSLQHDVRPTLGSWRFRPETGGGTVYELIHVFDMARFLGGEVRRIIALLSTSEPRRRFGDVPQGMDITVPDSSAYLLEFESGASGVLHTSFVSRGLENGVSAARVEASGEIGRIVTDGLERLRGVSGEQGDLQALDPGNPYPQPYEQFISAIQGGPPVSTSFYDGLKAAELVDAAYASARDARWVVLR